MRPRLTGLPYLADRATRLGGLPHLSCKHDQIKMRDYMERRRVTPPRRVTSPTWAPPPPLHVNRPLVEISYLSVSFTWNKFLLPWFPNTWGCPDNYYDEPAIPFIFYRNAVLHKKPITCSRSLFTFFAREWNEYESRSRSGRSHVTLPVPTRLLQTDIHSFLGNKPINVWLSFCCECSRL